MIVSDGSGLDGGRWVDADLESGSVSLSGDDGDSGDTSWWLLTPICGTMGNQSVGAETMDVMWKLLDARVNVDANDSVSEYADAENACVWVLIWIGPCLPLQFGSRSDVIGMKEGWFLYASIPVALRVPLNGSGRTTQR